MTDEAMSKDDYNLRLDIQVEEFVKLKQQLTYFIVSASVAVIVFTVNFGQDETLAPNALLLLALATGAGVLAAALALLNLHLEISSYRLHLKYRTAGVRSFEDLPEATQTQWSRLNSRAASLLAASFVGLAVEIVLASSFMWLLLAE